MSIHITPKEVSVDLGYGLNESWVTAKVIHYRTLQGLFNGTSTELLVELPSKARIWVSSWEEIENNNEDMKINKAIQDLKNEKDLEQSIKKTKRLLKALNKKNKT